MMDYDASITYRNPVPPNADRAERGQPTRAASSACGARSAAASTPAGAGYCPIDAVELTRGARGRPARRPGTITNYTIITPVQYPGQTETEPFARVFVLLDGTDVVLGYQPLSTCPTTRCASACGSPRCGRRRATRSTTAAPWAAPTATSSAGCPTGEPDVDDPDLVNRIF